MGMKIAIVTTLGAMALSMSANAQSPVTKEMAIQSAYGDLKPNLINGKVEHYVLRHADKISFALPDGRTAWLILPVLAPHSGTRPWVWQTPQDKDDVKIWDRLLHEGFAIAGLAAGNASASSDDKQAHAEFASYAASKFGLDENVSLCDLPTDLADFILKNKLKPEAGGKPAEAVPSPVDEKDVKDVKVKGVYGDLDLKLKDSRTDWYPLSAVQRICFGTDDKGHAGWLLLPRTIPLKGMRPWIWYSPQDLNDEGAWTWDRLLDAGFAIAGTYAGELQGSPEARKFYTSLYDVLTKEFGLDRKACLMPQSRGGLYLYNWAGEHPDCVKCIGGIYPVCDIRCWPAGINTPAFKDTCKLYGLSEEEMNAQLPKHNPIQHLEVLAARKIPIFHVVGDKDTVLPMEKHSLAMQAKYRELGGEMEVGIIPGRGHAGTDQAPELFHSQKLLDFFLKNGLKPDGGN